MAREPEHYLKWKCSQWLPRVIEAPKYFSQWAVTRRPCVNEREGRDSRRGQPIGVMYREYPPPVYHVVEVSLLDT